MIPSNGRDLTISHNKNLLKCRNSFYGSSSNFGSEDNIKSKFYYSQMSSTRNIKVKKATIDDIKVWQKGLEYILNDYYGLYHFNEFLKSEYSSENLDFWLACEKYKSIISRKKLCEMASSIYSEYIAIGSINEVNLDAKIRLQIIDQINSPNKKLYEVAQLNIFTLMAKDSYSRFLKSDYYLNLFNKKL